MLAKCPRNIVLALAGLLFAATASGQEDPAWARHRLLGQCFPNAQKFIETMAGPEALEDENIKIRPAAPLAGGNTWVVDETPQTNHEWYLLQPGDASNVCLTLFVPAAAQVTLKQGEKGQTAESRTQPSPDFPEKRVEFARAAGESTFHPKTCTEIRPSTGKRPASHKTVSCAGFFD